MFLYHAIQMMRYPDDLDRAMQTFWFSINYLGLLFGALLLDHYFLFQLSF
jgi:heme O synthase-like polyprenyltransferase